MICVRNLLDWPNSGICFTFDDAYRSTMANAPEIFERFGVRATFYAVTDLVGLTSKWDGPKAQPLADWDALRDAQKRGHEIGNHSVSHPHFKKLSAQAQILEISSAHARLLKEGITCESFCLPYGSFNDDSSVAIQKSGYHIGLSLRKGRAQLFHDRSLLPRIAVAYSDALPLLLYKLYLRPRAKILR